VTSFFQELQRRKVYRVAVGYVIAAGGIIQLASAVFPAWELPNWTLRLVIVLLLAGFPMALILAWAFDITSSGIEATRPVPFTGAHVRHRRRNVFLLVGLSLVIAIVAGFFILPRVAATKVEKSVAVLPFENYSDDKSNTYFADGIQDDILTALSRISDLKVISRTSVMGYRHSSKNVREIGKALGAGAVLEGSVRREGNRVRVNVQLINAENDQHIWANEYDRELNDVFAIQSDLAREIAGALQAKLSPTEKARMTQKPTESGEAYLAFVQARDLQWVVEDSGKMKKAEQLYQRALQLDPGFALAYAGYSQLESWIYHTWDPAPARREQGRTLANRALELQPDLPEGHLALGFSYYYGSNDFPAALREFQVAQRGLPNSMEAVLAIGAIQRRQGHWSESNASLEKAASLSPKDSWALSNLALNYEMQRQFDRANEIVDRALKITPDSIGLLGIKARVAVEKNSDFAVAEQALAAIEKLPPSVEKAYSLCEARGAVFLLQRKYREVVQLAEQISDETLGGKKEIVAAKYLILGQGRKGLRDEAGARAAFAKARELLEPLFASRPDDPNLHGAFALVLAYLGEKEKALSEAETAVRLLPLSNDAFQGPDILTNAAAVYALTGEKARALSALGTLLKVPSLVTVEILKINPIWDSLRDDSGFQQLLARHRRSPNGS
jgi:TolB-like protein/Tfp pilus assembly protein PilF